jgi:hypothetical protein
VRLVGRLVAIEEAAAKRLTKNPHADGAADASVVIMLFEALRAADTTD